MILLAEASWGELGAWWIKGWEFAAGEFLAYHFRFLSSPVLRRCFPLIRNYRQIRTHQAETCLAPVNPHWHCITYSLLSESFAHRYSMQRNFISRKFSGVE